MTGDHALNAASDLGKRRTVDDASAALSTYITVKFSRELRSAYRLLL